MPMRSEDGEDLLPGSEVIRIIDPRLRAASYQKAEGSSNIIDDLSDEDIIVQPAVEAWTSRRVFRQSIICSLGIGKRDGFG